MPGWIVLLVGGLMLTYKVDGFLAKEWHVVCVCRLLQEMAGVWSMEKRGKDEELKNN